MSEVRLDWKFVMVVDESDSSPILIEFLLSLLRHLLHNEFGVLIDDVVSKNEFQLADCKWRTLHRCFSRPLFSNNVKPSFTLGSLHFQSAGTTFCSLLIARRSAIAFSATSQASSPPPLFFSVAPLNLLAGLGWNPADCCYEQHPRSDHPSPMRVAMMSLQKE